MLNLTFRSAFIALLSATLTACGSSSGGGGGSISVAPDEKPQEKPAVPENEKSTRPTIGYVGGPISFNKNTSLKDTNGFINDFLLLKYGKDFTSSIIPRLHSPDAPLEAQVNPKTYTIISSLDIQGKKEADKITGTLAVYRQAHSSIVIANIDKVEGKIEHAPNANSLFLAQVIGTPSDKLPSLMHKVEYSGPAFSNSRQGLFHYEADFLSLTGEGHIKDLPEGEIKLLSEPLRSANLGPHQGRGVSNGKVEIAGKKDVESHTYELLFYGQDANEIVGRVVHETGDIVFTGSR